METITTKKHRHARFKDFPALVSGFRRTAGAVLAAGLVALASSASMSAQTFTSLLSFNGTNGSEPLYGSLAQGRDGNLWGTTALGGTNNLGTVYKVSLGGTLTTVYNFGTTPGDGSEPYPNPILGTDGNFYGTNHTGTVYKLTPGGVFAVLANVSADGNPDSPLIQGRDGALYGVTYSFSGGTVYKVTLSGVVTILHTFSGPDGRGLFGGLIQGTDGNFYGTSQFGGAFDEGGETGGTVFRITPTGTLMTLHSFDGSDGEVLPAGLVQAKDGNLYGATYEGGMFGFGTIFKITPAGVLTTLYNFDVTDGQWPGGALVQGTDGNLYGTTSFGGDNSLGTLFKITTAGALTVLHSFNGTDGSGPFYLVQDTNGKFYGTTISGGTDNDGTIFSLDMGLGSFVETLPTFGKLGAVVGILGSGFTGATAVTFNGTAATFTVTSATYISTSVPNNATTGTVKVVTPGHTYSSNLKFRVTPTILSFSPPSGPVGTSVTITGNSLTGATAVTFDGVRATTFTVNSYTQITATVPSGAITGKIGVTTPGGTALSSAVFTVTQ